MRATHISVALALALPLWSAIGPQEPRPGRGAEPQEPAPQEPAPKGGSQPKDQDPAEPERDIYGRKRDRGATGGVREEVQGAWRLLDIELTGYPELGGSHAGMLLVSDGFLALELHMTWPTNAGGADVHQTFLGEYEFRLDDQLQVNTIIGSFLDETSGELKWERAGFGREYTVSVTEKVLVLAFGRGNSMTFGRMRPTRTQERDVYGRPMRDAGTDRDIYGRRRPRTTGEGEEPKPEPIPQPGGSNRRTPGGGTDQRE
jgi:hypothetical protein